MDRTKILCLVLLSIATLFGCKTNSESIKSADDIEKSTYYKEQHRPQYHFSPEANWMNDPNGMVYHEGEYHLFYQYYPDSTVWGPMHWAHAVSKDMVYWEHLPIGLYPDSLGYIFSGSAVIDKDNTAGFGKDAMIAIYTYHDMEAEQSGNSNTYQYQAIAYSTDKGRTFTKYEGNPVVPNPGIKDFRDPKVIWDDNSNQWIMTFAAYDHVKFYGSPNLREWTHLSDWGKKYGGHGGVWECPDLFPIRVSDTQEVKWVLLVSINPGGPNGGSATQYFVGDFDGKSFVMDPSFTDDVINEKAVWLDYGKDNYAGVTWSNAPTGNDEKLFIGWMSNWQYAQVVPTEKWRSAMTLPRILKLHKENDEYRVRSTPIEQVKELLNTTSELEPKVLTGTINLSEIKSGLLKFDIKLDRPSSSTVQVKLSNNKGEYVVIGYDGVGQNYYIDRNHSGSSSFSKDFAGIHAAPVEYDSDYIEMHIYLDHSSVELFADEGRTVMTETLFPSEPFTKIEVISSKGEIELISGSISEVKRIWD